MLLKILLFVLSISVMHFKVTGQPAITLQKAFGGNLYEDCHSVFVLKDGGLLVGGTSLSNKSGEKKQNIRGGFDNWIVRTDSRGKLKWSKTIGGISDDLLKSAIQTADGGFALIGESYSNTSVEKDEDSRGLSDYWVVKLDKEGNIQWNRTYGGNGVEFADNIVETRDGSFIISGSSESFASGEKSEHSRGLFDYWILKIDKKGNKVWDKTIGGSDYEWCSPLELTSDGGVITGGFSSSPVSGEKSENSRGSYDYWVVKLDKNGSIQWDKTIGGNDVDVCRGIRQNNRGGYVLSGYSVSNASGEKTENSRGGYDYWVVELDSKGKQVKDKTIGGSGDDNDVWCLEKTMDGGYIFGGNSDSYKSGEKSEDSRGSHDYWVIKLDKNLNIQWDKTVGGNSYEAMRAVGETRKDEFILAGTSYSDISGDKTEPNRGWADFWVVWLSTSKNKDYEHSEHSSVITGDELKNKDESKGNAFYIYPNPARDFVNIQSKGRSTFTLTDQSGKAVMIKQVENYMRLDVSRLAKGLYFLKNSSTKQSEKIIIAR